MMNKIVAFAVVLLLGCSTTPSTRLETQPDGQLRLAEAQLGEQYDVVMSRSLQQYKSDPHCETRKVSLRKQRKAFVYDICAFNPTRKQFSGAPLSEVVFHFIERSLVRIDVRAEGDKQIFDEIKTDISGVLITGGAEAQRLKAGSYEWLTQNEIAGVRAGQGASAGNVHVRVLDKSLRVDAPWLAVE